MTTKLERSNKASASIVMDFAVESNESLGYFNPVARCGMFTIEFPSGIVPVSQLLDKLQSSEATLPIHVLVFA